MNRSDNGHPEPVPDYVEHRKRLRERFRKSGAEGMHDYELLELLLTYAIPRKDVKPVGKSLIKRFGGLAGVLDANQDELECVRGLGTASAILIRLAKQLCEAYLAEQMAAREALSSPRTVMDFARAKLAGLPHEAFMVVYLNVKNEVIGHELIHEGTLDRAVIYPRRVIESALANRAACLILVHNHPSGHTDPSPEDKKLTRMIKDAARTVEITVLDHIIVGKSGYFSFAEQEIL
ncbi:MAG TPA: DNA repair protein RadC [Blastocatellia bacterium]|nr:DNA repair protein RadC [Blastocatellia bacterium]